MKRDINLNTLASEKRANARRPDALNTPSHKRKSKKGNTRVIANDRLMPFSKVRSLLLDAQSVHSHNAIRAGIKATNIVEDYASESISYLIEAIRRLQRLQASVLERSRGEAITNLLVGRIDNAHTQVLAMLKGDDDARALIENALSILGIPEEAIEAEAYLLSIDHLERIQRSLAYFQLQIDQLLKQIERRRLLVAAEVKALAQVSNEHDEEAEVARRDAQEEDHADACDRECEDNEEGVF